MNTPHQPIPSPSRFAHKRLNSIPPRKESASDKTHAFVENSRPRGSNTSQALVDASIFIATGAAHAINAVALFGLLYSGRAYTTDAIRDEILNRALNPLRDLPMVAPAAKRSRDYLLNSGRVSIQDTPLTQDFLGHLQAIHRKLIALAQARRSDSGVGTQMAKHAGEATLIAVAGAFSEPTLLTNDGGASIVAASESPPIPSLHFGDVLRELMCHNRDTLTTDQLKTAFGDACLASDIAYSAKPTNEDTFFTCHFAAQVGQCSICN